MSAAAKVAGRNAAIKTSVGFYSAAGPRPENQDFAGAVFGADLPEPRRDVVAAWIGSGRVNHTARTPEGRPGALAWVELGEDDAVIRGWVD